MHIATVILGLCLAHGYQVSAQQVTSFIGGRATCGAFNRAVTAASFVSSNCYRLTNANASLACSRYSNKPTVVNYGTSSFVALCNDPVLISSGGPRFGIFSTATYYPDLQVVSSDTSAALGGLINYLSYDTNTGYIQENISPSYDVTQVYSFVLINKQTGATSDPVYFTAKLLGCSLVLAGPTSLTVCTGPGPLLTFTTPGTPVATYTVCNPGTAPQFQYDTLCPMVTASSNGDFTTCYIQTFGIFSPTTYVLGAVPYTLTKFTQTLLLSAQPAPPGNFLPSTKSIIVTFDPSCNPPGVTGNC